MSDNVVPFDSFENDLQISTFQSETPRVVLEGGDDVSLFKIWFFNYLDRLEFVQAANLGVGAGCTAVRAAVEKLRDQGVRAFGLSDRDRLFRSADWATLFSVDDDTFLHATEDDYVAVNSLWEIEAYLIHPDLIPDWVSSTHRKAPVSDGEVDAALARTLKECEALLQAQPWLATAHRCGEHVPDGKYCQRSADEFASDCEKELDGIEDTDATATTIKLHVAKVLENAPTSPNLRILWLLRYVDTKRLMLRLQHHLQLANVKHKWLLAQFMKARGLRPLELENRVHSLSVRLNS